jgi:hypothetical protein
MAQMKVDLPKELNKLLRRYAIDYEKGSREKSTLFILENYLFELYKNEREKKE